jgi:asparagine synthase (glutamine-hydrolysing)
MPLARRLPADRHSPALDFLRLARAFVFANELGFEDRYRSYVEVFQRTEVDDVLRDLPDHSAGSRLGDLLWRTNGADPLRRLLEVDMATQLPDDLLMLTDKMTMATSIECRVPLLDQKLVELSARIPASIKIKNGELKHVMKAALAPELPGSILNRKKRGFGAPMGAWLKAELASLLDHVLSAASLERRGVFNPSAVQKLIAEHTHARHDRTEHLLALMNFEIWARIFLDGQKPEDVAGEIAERAAA